MNIPLGAYWDLLAKHIASQRARFVLLALLLLGGIGLQLVSPQIVSRFIDRTSSGQGGVALTYAALAFIGIALLQQVVTVGATYVGENVAWTATNALRAELARHCLVLDMGFHNDHSPGELIERIDGDVEQLSTFFSQLVIRVLGNLLLMLGVLIALALKDWRVGVAFGVLALLSVLILYRIRGIAVHHFKARRQAEADLFGYVEEQLAGTEDIRSSGAVGYVLRGLYDLQYKILRCDYKASVLGHTIGLITGALLTLGRAMAVVVGYHLHRSGAITVGAVYLIVQYINLLSNPIRELTRQVESLQTVGASVDRLTELRQVRGHVQDGPGSHIPAGPLALAFEDVSFAYVEEETVLRELSFHLPPGHVLGLLGRTGSGKTTLARLVFRLYDPTAGQISLHGVDIRQSRLKGLRQRVALVTQDVQLFQASVRDNLTFFDRNIPDERIRAAIEALELVDWYASLPQGLDTRLETGGRGLSAGEAQLLAFTRVFLRDPGLVVLDEASSRLDPATEQRIERAVDVLLQDRTAIVIAHRLGTVQRADEVMILDQGRAVEHGARERLAADPTSRFYGLLQTGLEEVLV
jgi:ABC-type multidrug transport system fused ATPase/permease subunit